MTFDEAVQLTQDINLHGWWSAEIDAGGLGDDTYFTVQARFDRGGLIYNAEIEEPHEWPIHYQRIEFWQANRSFPHGSS